MLGLAEVGWSQYDCSLAVQGPPSAPGNWVNELVSAAHAVFFEHPLRAALFQV